METSPIAATDVFEAMVQASPLAIVVLDRDGKVTTWNPAAQRMFGWGANEVVGQEPPFIPKDKQAAFSALRAQEMGGEIRDGLELRRQRKDGTLLDVSLWTAPIRDAAGNIIAQLGLFEDITGRKRAEEERRKQTGALEAIQLINAEITTELNLTALLALIYRRAMELVKAAGGSLFLWDEATQRLMPRCGVVYPITWELCLSGWAKVCAVWLRNALKA